MLDLVKVIIHTSHKVFQMLLQLRVVGDLGERKFLHISHVSSDFVEDRQVIIVNECFLLLNALVMKLRADIFAHCCPVYIQKINLLFFMGH
jgi:hypothetical protein